MNLKFFQTEHPRSCHLPYEKNNFNVDFSHSDNRAHTFFNCTIFPFLGHCDLLGNSTKKFKIINSM